MIPRDPARAERWRTIARMWESQQSRTAIARTLDMDPAEVGAELARMRQSGWRLPRPDRELQVLWRRRRKRICSMWAKGATVPDIAGSLGMTPAAVSGVIARMRRTGWDVPYRAVPRLGATPRADQIAKMWDAGRTLREIAEAMGVDLREVSSEMARMRRDPHGRWPLPHRDQESRVWHAEIAALALAGMTNAEIAKAVGSTPASVATLLSRMRGAGQEIPGRSSQAPRVGTRAIVSRG